MRLPRPPGQAACACKPRARTTSLSNYGTRCRANVPAHPASVQRDEHASSGKWNVSCRFRRRKCKTWLTSLWLTSSWLAVSFLCSPRMIRAVLPIRGLRCCRSHRGWVQEQSSALQLLRVQTSALAPNATSTMQPKTAAFFVRPPHLELSTAVAGSCPASLAGLFGHVRSSSCVQVLANK